MNYLRIGQCAPILIHFHLAEERKGLLTALNCRNLDYILSEKSLRHLILEDVFSSSDLIKPNMYSCVVVKGTQQISSLS